MSALGGLGGGDVRARLLLEVMRVYEERGRAIPLKLMAELAAAGAGGGGGSSSDKTVARKRASSKSKPKQERWRRRDGEADENETPPPTMTNGSTGTAGGRQEGGKGTKQRTAAGKGSKQTARRAMSSLAPAADEPSVASGWAWDEQEEEQPSVMQEQEQQHQQETRAGLFWVPLETRAAGEDSKQDEEEQQQRERAASRQRHRRSSGVEWTVGVEPDVQPEPAAAPQHDGGKTRTPASLEKEQAFLARRRHRWGQGRLIDWGREVEGGGGGVGRVGSQPAGRVLKPSECHVWRKEQGAAAATGIVARTGLRLDQQKRAQQNRLDQAQQARRQRQRQRQLKQQDKARAAVVEAVMGTSPTAAAVRSTRPAARVRRCGQQGGVVEEEEETVPLGDADAITLTARKFVAFRRQQQRQVEVPAPVPQRRDEKGEEEHHEARARRAAASAAKEAAAAAALAASISSSVAAAALVVPVVRPPSTTSSVPQQQPAAVADEPKPKKTTRRDKSKGKSKRSGASGGVRARLLRSVALSEEEEEEGVRSDLNGQVASLEKQVEAVERLLKGMPPLGAAGAARQFGEEEESSLRLSPSSSSAPSPGFGEGPELEQFAYDEEEAEAAGTKIPADEGEGVTTLEELEARIRSLEMEGYLAGSLGEEEASAAAVGQQRKKQQKANVKIKLNEAFLASSGQAAPGMLGESAETVGGMGSSVGSYEKLHGLLARIDQFQQECRDFDPSASAASVASAVSAAAGTAPAAAALPITNPTKFAASGTGSWAPSLALSSSAALGATPLFSASAHARQLDDLEARLEALTALIHDESLRVPALQPRTAAPPVMRV